jgi:IS605 OrfB family transposase
MSNIDNKPKTKIKTYAFYNKNKHDNKIFDYMTTISKNIYNCTLYCYKVYKQFEDNIYKELYDDIIKHKYIDKLTDVIKQKQPKSKSKIKNKDKIGKKDKKDITIIKIEEKLYNIYDNYYNLYSLNKNAIDNNNQIIYKYIIENIKVENIIIDKNNINNLFNKYKIEVIKLNNIINDSNNENILIDNIIKNILSSFYYKNIYYIKNLLNINQEKNINKKYNIIIESIKNNSFYIENNSKYSIKVKNELSIPITSVQNLIKHVSIRHLDNNKEKIPADVIGNIIDKMYGDISNYYDLLKSGKQKNVGFCKYKQKDEKFNLFYYCRSFKIENNKIRLNVGDYINHNYNFFNKINLEKIQIKKSLYYYDKNDLIEKIKSKSEIRKNYIEINDKIIEKIKLIKFNYIYINLPNKIKNYKINLIEIKSNGYNIKICIIYDFILINNIESYNLDKFNKLKPEEKLEKSISIDTGIKNLLTIYNPTGIQHIIKGNKLLSINYFYNYKIDKLKSLNKINYNKNKFLRLYSLEQERQNKINGFLNKVINELIEIYHNKEVFIIGYNPNWKTNVNLGKETNRNFYQIPYRRLITKLDEALKIRNKKLIILKESYTSKCDSLALEEVNYHETYKGNRLKRGLFSSSTNKLLNADINGAINIMRKCFPITKITGIRIFNPLVIQI